MTDDHRAALLAVLEAAQRGTPDELREALTDCAQVHERHGLSGADWMRAGAYVLDPQSDPQYVAQLAAPQQ